MLNLMKIRNIDKNECKTEREIVDINIETKQKQLQNIYVHGVINHMKNHLDFLFMRDMIVNTMKKKLISLKNIFAILSLKKRLQM